MKTSCAKKAAAAATALQMKCTDFFSFHFILFTSLHFSQMKISICKQTKKKQQRNGKYRRRTTKYKIQAKCSRLLWTNPTFAIYSPRRVVKRKAHDIHNCERCETILLWQISCGNPWVFRLISFGTRCVCVMAEIQVNSWDRWLWWCWWYVSTININNGAKHFSVREWERARW